MGRMLMLLLCSSAGSRDGPESKRSQRYVLVWKSLGIGLLPCNYINFVVAVACSNHICPEHF